MSGAFSTEVPKEKEKDDKKDEVANLYQSQDKLK
jgi:hypothetical protein